MDKKQYATYLASLIEDIDVDVENENLSEEFFAFFQCFMPDGTNAAKIFEPLENGQSLFARILPIYQATKQKTLQQFSEGISPGYFCPPPSANDTELENLGKQHIQNLIQFSKFVEDIELEEMLTEVDEIIIVAADVPVKDDYLNSYLYDAVSDWGLENEDENGLIGILSEAYYSINCDYYLSYYLQYPAFNNKPEQDFLQPYFEIWKAGYYCKLDKTKLLIYK